MTRLCRLRLWCGQTEWAERIWNTFEKVTGQSLVESRDRLNRKEQAILMDVRGQMLRAKGESDAAMAVLKEAVALEPDPAALGVAEYLRACHEAGRPEDGAEAARRLQATKGVEIRSWNDLLPRYLQLWREGARGVGACGQDLCRRGAFCAGPGGRPP